MSTITNEQLEKAMNEARDMANFTLEIQSLLSDHTEIVGMTQQQIYRLSIQKVEQLKKNNEEMKYREADILQKYKSTVDELYQLQAQKDSATIAMVALGQLDATKIQQIIDEQKSTIEALKKTINEQQVFKVNLEQKERDFECSRKHFLNDIAGLQLNVKVNYEKIDQLEKENKRLRLELDEAKKDAEIKFNSLESCAAETAELSQEIDGCKQTIKTQTERINELVELSNLQRAEMKRIRSEHEDKAVKHCEQITEYAHNNANLKSENQNLTTENEDLKKKLREIEGELETCRKLFQGSQDHIVKQVKKIDGLTIENTNLTKQVEEQKNDFVKLGDELLRVNGKRQEFAEKLEAAQKELEKVRQEMADLRREYEYELVNQPEGREESTK